METSDETTFKIRVAKHVRLAYRFGGGQLTGVYSTLENELIKNEWNFLAITIDGTANENFIYVNDGYGSNTKDDKDADEPTNGRVSISNVIYHIGWVTLGLNLNCKFN